MSKNIDMMDTPEPPLFSFAAITDSHLTVNVKSEVGANDATEKLTVLYEEAIKRVAAMNPAFVVHLGDMADPVPTSDAQEASARMFHEVTKKLPMPYYVVPGNHDIGEKLHKALPYWDDRVSITSETIAKYQKMHGPDHYNFEHAGCLFVVLNTLLVNSGFEEEEAQWTWLTQTLGDHKGKRIFVLTHYPLYLADRDEPDYYDNIEEPGRSRLINLLQKHGVEGYFAGHVHNFFYDYLDGLHHTVLPSASILRTDYMELFSSCPTRDMGSFDPAKLGFLWVDVYADTHVTQFVRSSTTLPYRTHSWKSAGSTVSMDLRLPWCEDTDIPCAWGLEIFERKEVRNDYPLAALWEMGVTDLRIPISDLLKPRVSHRVKQLTALGHRFTVVSYGLPTATRLAAIKDHADGIKAVEVIGILKEWTAFVSDLSNLRRAGRFEIFFNAVRPEVQGWTTHHGLHADLTDELDRVMAQPELRGTVDGFVFGLPRDTAPFDGLAAVLDCLDGTGFKAQVHVPSVGMVWGTKHNETMSEAAEIARTAEAAFLARAHPEVSIVIDNFVELDRGYCGCQGLVDRFYNPKDGSRMLTSMNALLPSDLTGLTYHVAGNTRIISARHTDGRVMLISENEAICSEGGALDQDTLRHEGKLISLTTGQKRDMFIQDALYERADAKGPNPPVLFFLPA